MRCAAVRRSQYHDLGNFWIDLDKRLLEELPHFVSGVNEQGR